KRWAEENDAVTPADPAHGEDFYTADHANGTGPFMLDTREPDVATKLVANPHWWDERQHNLDEVMFVHIRNDEERVAALLSGDVDMLYAVPMNDIEMLRATAGIKLIQGPELRTVFLGFDQSSDELSDSDVKGRNPFKDVRVRRAFYQAIDEGAIK